MYVFVYKGIKCHEAEFLDVKFSALYFTARLWRFSFLFLAAPPIFLLFTDIIIDCSADDSFRRFILTINVLVVYIYGAWHNNFEADKFILRAIGRGSALKIKTFFGSWKGNKQSECRLGPKITVSCRLFQVLNMAHVLPLMVRLQFTVSCTVADHLNTYSAFHGGPASCLLNIYNMFKCWEKWWHCVGSACLQRQAASQFCSTGQITA